MISSDRNEYVVETSDLSMVFNMAKDRTDHLKEYLIKLIKRQLIFEPFIALNGVSFSVKRGDTFGILGVNGSGKSTLLKIIAGVMKPTKGIVKTNGAIAPLLELGAGFDMELTARENIFLNGSMLGFSRRFLKENFDDIVEFSEMRQFLDIPMKNYSSGMVARVGFSIATCVAPDILIADEILGVGDYRFIEKCELRIADMRSRGTTILFVSHDIEQVKRICNNALWLERGNIIMQGNAESVCDAYSK